MKSATLIFLSMLAFAMTAAASSPTLSDAVPPDSGFAPGLLFAALFSCAVLLVLVGIGIVIGVAFLACASVFIALGVISTSALIAIVKRRFSAGLRALHYQLSALIGLPCGIGALWLGCLLFEVHLRHRYVIAAGSAIGVVAGIVIAFILDRFSRFVYRRFMQASGLRVPT